MDELKGGECKQNSVRVKGLDMYKGKSVFDDVKGKGCTQNSARVKAVYMYNKVQS